MFRLIVQKRPPANLPLRLGIHALALVAGLGAVGVVFLLAGVNPLEALGKIFAGAFGSWFGLSETVTKAIPLILVGTGLALSFRGRFWNIGAEGQLLAGAIAATGFGLFLGRNWPATVAVPAVFAAGFIGGATWGLLPAWWRIHFRVNETLSTLMLNYIAAEFTQYLVYGPWKGITQYGYPYTDNLPPAYQLPVISASRIHYPTLILAVAGAVAAGCILARTRFGYELRVCGANPDAARYSGMNARWTIIMSTIIGSGLAGLAGAGEVAGIHHHLTYPWTISAGYGFIGIIVAWLAGLNPILVIPAALFIGGLLVGGDTIQTSLGLSAATVQVVNGLILLALVAGEFFLRYSVKVKIKASFHRHSEKDPGN